MPVHLGGLSIIFEGGFVEAGRVWLVGLIRYAVWVSKLYPVLSQVRSVEVKIEI